MRNLDFTEFFQAVNGMPPLPWQVRLADQLIDGKGWPALIDLPTASGKTACIDIAIFHLAWCAARGEPWRAARRIVLVVDRRIIVDAAFERAARIRDALADSENEAIRVVAEALEKLGGETPLHCQKLRGGMARERGFATNPAQPMVITSTIDQIGSRLLFRGYGLSQYAHPLHAGLLGHDTLLLLDEAHLGEPFIQTITAIRREQTRAIRQLTPLRPIQLVSLSATARATGERFQLDADDLANPKIQQRRATPKLTRLVETTDSATERLKALLRETLITYERIDSPAPAVAVIVNRVRTARELFTRLLAHTNREFDVKLVTGRSRPLDRDAIAQQLLARTKSDRAASPDDRGLIVVATQALEVGADLDFQGMVTECASVDALRQRFGRLDRLGRFRRSQAVILGNADSENDPIYGLALRETWLWLQQIARREGDQLTLNFSIAEIETALKSVEVATLSAIPRQVMQLTPAHVDLLCQTSPRPMCDPDVSALLHGFQAAPSDIQVVWRSDIPVRREDGGSVLDRAEAEFVKKLLAIIPPTSLEALSLPLHTLKAWLGGASSVTDLSDIEGVPEDSEEKAPSKRERRREVWLRTLDGWKAAHIGELRPGDTVVVPAAFGGCDAYGFAPESEVAVSDLYRLARKKLERETTLVFTVDVLREKAGPQLAHAVGPAWRAACDAYDSEESTPEQLLHVLLEALGTTPATELGAIGDSKVEVLTSGNGALRALILRSGQPGADDISDEDLSSSRTVPVPLDFHNAQVGRRARELAERVGLDDHFRSTLGCAGDRHDLGKADPRFQSLLRAGDNITLEGKLLAKGLRRVSSTHTERPERHEAYSVALLKMHPHLLAAAADPELALYLTGAHHGRGRGLMPDRPDEGTRFAVEVDGQRLEFDGAPRLGALGSGWPSLFWRLNERYGVWGLAYLEALLRLADQLQSRAEVTERGRHD